MGTVGSRVRQKRGRCAKRRNEQWNNTRARKEDPLCPQQIPARTKGERGQGNNTETTMAKGGRSAKGKGTYEVNRNQRFPLPMPPWSQMLGEEGDLMEPQSRTKGEKVRQKNECAFSLRVRGRDIKSTHREMGNVRKKSGQQNRR